MTPDTNRPAASRTPQTSKPVSRTPQAKTGGSFSATLPAAQRHAPPERGSSGRIIRGVVLLLLVIGLGVTGWLAYDSWSNLAEARRQIKMLELAKTAERQELNATEAKMIAAQKEAQDNDALFDILAESIILDSDGAKNADKQPLSAALDRASYRLETGAFKDRPDLELTLRQTLGQAYLRIGLHDPAEKHLRRAFDLSKELFGEDRPEMLEALCGMGMVVAAKGQVEEATEYIKTAMEMYNKFMQEEPVGRVGHLLGMVQGAIDGGNYLEAADHYGYIVLLLERQFGKAHPQPIMARIPVGYMLAQGGETERAEFVFREVVSRMERIVPEIHPDLAVALAGLAGVLNDAGKYEEAERYARRCLKIRETVLPKDHWQRFSAICIVGDALAGQGKYEQAEKMLVRGYRGMARKDSEAPTRRKREVCEALVRVYESLGQYENVEKYQKLAQKFTEKRGRARTQGSTPTLPG